MEHDFWLDKWQRDEIGFHEVDTHPLLIRHWRSVTAGQVGRVLVPLCGKSNDLMWLRDRGHDVVGVELSEIAVQAFFADNALDFERSTHGPLARYAADRITLWCGDYFDLTKAACGEITWFYDRAALIALPPDMRDRYIAHLATLLAPHATGLLITISYDPQSFSPPPFAIDPSEVDKRYAGGFVVSALGEYPASAKGHPCVEHVFSITR